VQATNISVIMPGAPAAIGYSNYFGWNNKKTALRGSDATAFGDMIVGHAG